MSRRIQLLVHAGASSSRHDDERYAAQVGAYLALETGRILKDSSETMETSSINQIRDSQVFQQERGAVHEEIATIGGAAFHSSEYIDDTQLALTALESQLFTSSRSAAAVVTPHDQDSIRESSFGRTIPGTAPEPSTPVLGRNSSQSYLRSALFKRVSKRKRGDTDSTPSEDSRESEQRISQTPVPRAGDSGGDSHSSRSRPRSESEPASLSSYLFTPILDRAEKRACLDKSGPACRVIGRPLPAETKLRTFDISIPPQQSPKQVENEGSGGGTVASDETTSEMPTSYSLSDVASESPKDRPQPSQRSVSDPGPQTDDLPVKSDHSDTYLEVNSPRKGNVTDVAPLASIAVATPAESVRNRFAECLFRTPNEDQATFRSLSFEIWPPVVKTAVGAFSTHVTPELEHLISSVSNGKLAQAYRPMSIARELSVHERGHWLIDCVSLSAAEKIAFWRELETYIANGSAGWGVWCRRGAEERVGSQQNSAAGDLSDEQTSFGPVRVYCWGEIVKHVYLWLYVASMSRVRKLGLTWIDSEGKVVVQMKGQG